MLHEFVERIKDTAQEALGDVHTAMPGTIASIDYATGTATVIPKMQKVMRGGGKLDYPKITGVPILMSQGSGQNASIVYPVKEGDGCLVVVAEQSLDYWMYDMETDTDLRFDITNGICIPGLCNTANESLQEANEENAIIMKVGETKVKISEDTIEFEVKGKKFTLSEDGFDTDGEIKAKGVSLSVHTHIDSRGGVTTEATAD